MTNEKRHAILFLMKDETKAWLDVAEEDAQNAKLLWEHHRYGLAVFSYQQAVEKILKAYIVEFRNKRPTKTHRIEDLITEAGLDLTEIDSPDIVELSRAYIRVRYPDLNKQYFRLKERVEPLIQMGKTVYLWVQKKFKNR